MREVIKVGNHCFNKLFRTRLSSSKHMYSFSSISSEEIANSDTSSDHSQRLKSVQMFIPKLTSNMYKGQCGKIGVIGGSFEYTGAPYFSAISSLKMGADLVYVFCTEAAGPVIKSYSPELIVHPFLDSQDVVKKIEPWLDRLHVLIIGPGMGRNQDVLKNVADIINHCKKQMKSPLPLVIDADGLFLITEDLNLIIDYRGPLILTPNNVEFRRLAIKMSENDPLKIAATLNAVLLQKGPADIITNGMHKQLFELSESELLIICDVPGSNRRCGGQGDILSGCIATLVAWLEIYLKCNFDFDFDIDIDVNCDSNGKKDKEFFRNTFMLYSLVVYSACVVTRTSSRLAFEIKGRGMTASDMISYINKAFTLNFGQ